MQRILPRGEIENLDHTRIPRLRMPERAGVFSDRAARLRSLADSSSVGGYLLLMARLAQAQQTALKAFEPPAVDAAIERAKAHDMPVLPAVGLVRDPGWRTLLGQLLDEVAGSEDAPEPAAEACATLRRTLDASPTTIEDMADALLAGVAKAGDAAAAPFIMAALQVYWTGMAAALE